MDDLSKPLHKERLTISYEVDKMIFTLRFKKNYDYYVKAKKERKKQVDEP